MGWGVCGGSDRVPEGCRVPWRQPFEAASDHRAAWCPLAFKGSIFGTQCKGATQLVLKTRRPIVIVEEATNQ
jgi:hypothetical protein